MVEEGEKRDHVIHERKLRYYKKTVQLLSVSLEVFVLFFIAAIVFLFVAGVDVQTLEAQNIQLLSQQQVLETKLLTAQETTFFQESMLNSLSLPISQLKDDQFVASFIFPNGVFANITVELSDIFSQIQLGYQRRELVEEVNIPMHARYAQYCFNFALFCADDPTDIVELKNYYSSELDVLRLSSPQYIVLPLGATTKTVMDFRDFVTPGGFEEEVQTWFRERKSDEEFLEQLWFIVSQLSSYTGDIKETPRYPLETLLLGGGDCEDMAILFASMLYAADSNWKISFLYTDLQHPEFPYKFNHVLVHVDTGKEEFFIETTNKEMMNPYELVTGELLVI